MTNKLTYEQWEKLDREEKKQAILEFREPENIKRSFTTVDRIDKDRFL
jgi:hypothetical protein